MLSLRTQHLDQKFRVGSVRAPKRRSPMTAAVFLISRTDLDRGTWSFDYDAFGQVELETQTIFRPEGETRTLRESPEERRNEHWLRLRNLWRGRAETQGEEETMNEVQSLNTKLKSFKQQVEALQRQRDDDLDTIQGLSESLREAVVLAQDGQLPDEDAVAAWRFLLELPDRITEEAS